jgi:hypothetical protein
VKEFVKVSLQGSKSHRFVTALMFGALVLTSAEAQTSAPGQDTTATPQPSSAPDAPPPPQGQVLFQSHGDAPVLSEAPSETAPVAVAKPAGPELTDRERSAVFFTAYDLDARLVPTSSQLAMRARLTLRNDGTVPLNRVALQVSSTLQWESASLVDEKGSEPLELTQHLLDSDVDHTGKVNEAILTLRQPLAPGKSLQLDTFYSGAITANGGRLERIGATHAQALSTDWDEISADATALRGFGSVLWYPSASPQLFLGDGAQLFDAIGASKLRESTATVRLRLSVEYKGDPPVAAYFCGRRVALKAISDNSEAPISSGAGVATAEFAAEPLGFRDASLFLVDRAESLIAPLPSYAAPVSDQAVPEPVSAAAVSSTSSSSRSASSSTDSAAVGTPMLAVETDDDAAVPSLALAAEQAVPLLQEWLGPEPLSALTVLDHSGQPFEDGPLLVAPAGALAAASSGQALVHSLTHAWMQTGRPWMDEGLAQFFALLWTERQQGRDAAMAQLNDLMQPLSIAEPAIDPAMARDKAAPNGELVGQVVGQPLIAASSDLYYRRKAAAVWWMLRGIVGDEPLQLALQTWRMREPAHTTAEQDALAFETILEHSGKKNAQNALDLRWFFSDWVLHDRGLPDLSITDVTPRELPAGRGHSAGWLVSVTVHNDGAASAEVPVTIRAKTYSTTSRLRIAGFADATARVLVEAAPAEVLVNDGSTPEVRASIHKLDVVLHQQQTILP